MQINLNEYILDRKKFDKNRIDLYKKVDNIDDIPKDYVIWNIGFKDYKGYIPFIKLIPKTFTVDTTKQYYALNVKSEVLKQIIMNNSIKYNRSTIKQLKEDLKEVK